MWLTFAAADAVRLLLNFPQHMLFKFRYPRFPGTPYVVHPTDKRTGFSETQMQAVLEVVEDYENKLKDATEEAVLLRENNAQLEAHLNAAWNKIEDLERATAFYGGYEDIGTQQQFLADLQARVIISEQLNSSMQDEIQRGQQENGELQRQLGEYARDAVVREEECMQNVLDLSKRIRIDSMLLDEIVGVVERSGVMDPNPQDCQEVVERWTSRINQTINQNAGEIGELLQKVDTQIRQITDLEGTVERQRNQIENLHAEVRRLRELAEIRGVPGNILDRSPRSFTPPAVLSKSDPGLIRNTPKFERFQWYYPVEDEFASVSDFNIPGGKERIIELGLPFQSPPSNPKYFRQWQTLFANQESPKLGSLPSTPVMPREERPPREGQYTFPGATRPGEVDSPSLFYCEGMSQLDPALRDSDAYEALYKFMWKFESPEIDVDKPLDNWVFARGNVPTALRIGKDPETGYNQISLVEDRGYYPGFLPPGAEAWDEAQGDIRQGRSPPPAHHFSGRRLPNRVIRPEFRPEIFHRVPLDTQIIERAPLGTQVIGRAPLGTQVIGRAPLGTQVIGRAPLGTQVIGRAPLGTQVIGRAPLGTQVIGRAPLGTQVIGRAPLGTQVISPSLPSGRARLGTQVISPSSPYGRARLGTQVISPSGRAPLGTQVISPSGRAPLGTQVISPSLPSGRARLGTQVISPSSPYGRARLGTQVISPPGRPRLGTQVISPPRQETHPDTSFYSAASGSISSSNIESLAPELIIDDIQPTDFNRTIRFDDVFLPQDPLLQVPVPQVPVPQVPVPQVPVPQVPVHQQIFTPSRIPRFVPGTAPYVLPSEIERIFRRVVLNLTPSGIPTRIRKYS
ncbi:uncharacterized protein TNCT_236131 [Trichonephila clavata]|uniref:Uncharacterized protein n=1 Tax=Trichonephila clavata TaxID=2740835 RepID=A0A8X6JFJ8_TRICU|nr:uncharacterized protein TNCT_236131 [Trichonephila clavata]